MPGVMAHPGQQMLLAFHLGKLAAADASSIAEHVIHCIPCQQRVETLPDDALLKIIRPFFHAGPAVRGLPPDSWIPADLIDHPRYRLVKWLGAGGMGVVFQAEHKVMRRPVALKVISRKLTSNAGALTRFRREIRSAAKLSHPNIVAAYDAEQAGDLHFLVMEYVEGVSLARLVEKKGPLPIAHACLFARQAALALQHAHERGLIHRDVKPQNLMVTRRGQVKVLDLGLAALMEADQDDSTPTADGQILGTPDYMAPEQVRNARAVDARADIYSLGCTLYFLLTGQPPYPDGTALQKVAAQLDGSPTPLAKLRPELPAELIGVVERMMAKSPGQRYQTAGAVADALRPFVRANAAGNGRRWRWLFGGLAAILLLAAWLNRDMIRFTAWPPVAPVQNAVTEPSLRNPEQSAGTATATEHKSDNNQEQNDPKKVSPKKLSSSDGKDFID